MWHCNVAVTWHIPPPNRSPSFEVSAMCWRHSSLCERLSSYLNLFLLLTTSVLRVTFSRATDSDTGGGVFDTSCQSTWCVTWRQGVERVYHWANDLRLLTANQHCATVLLVSCLSLCIGVSGFTPLLLVTHSLTCVHIFYTYVRHSIYKLLFYCSFYLIVCY